MEEKDIDKRVLEIAELYDEVDTSDLQGMLLALETMSGIHYQTLYNRMAEIVIRKRLNNNIREMEKEFDCDIDYDVDYNIAFKYQ